MEVEIAPEDAARLDCEKREMDTYGGVVRKLLCEVNAWRLARRIMTWDRSDVRALKALLGTFAAEAIAAAPPGVGIWEAFGIDLAALPSEKFEKVPGRTVWAVDRSGRALAGDDFRVVDLASMRRIRR